MMRPMPLVLAGILVAFCACAHSESGARTAGDGTAAARVRETNTGDAPASLKLTAAETPAAVRAIEDLIDDDSVILAEEAEIFVSKNYQFDVSLSGNIVSHDLDNSGVNERIASGDAIAFVRNLQIKCDRRIRVRIADFGTVPFIRIAARGKCSHIQANGGKGAVRRSDAILVENDSLRYVDDPQASGRVASVSR